MKDLTKMYFPDWYKCEYKQKVLDLANHIGRKKPGSKGAYQWDDPEYVILEAGVDDEMAEVGMGLGISKKRTVKEIAAIVNKPEDYCFEQLKKLAVYGVCFWNTIDGEEVFWAETWIPGTMEMIVNNSENCKKYPIIGYAMEAYGRVRGPKSSGAFPPGVGLMRVIPIETAIEGNTRRASYEEVSKYLNENDIFTVTDCSCRTDRELMGEGCGHLKEDMCIQMGHAAEYYIKTGRGRQITREEAFEIIKRAEENGLMHQIPNIDGSGKTHAICNCCGCGCLSLRTAEMFKNNDMVRSNYVARVDKEKCVACGQCVENCPVNALKLGQKLCSSKPVTENITTKVTPRDTVWTEEHWNPDYRINREDVVETGTAPCKTNCPAHIGVQGYIKLASQGKYKEALELIKYENPLPAVCGRICNRRCEDACTRGDVDEPIAIDEIKKFIAQQELDPQNRIIPKKRHNYSDKKVAIIGAGPAGLSCAYYLALDGYSITVFEKEQKLGGMLTMGIPAFRLEKDVVQAEIDIIKAMGVEFKTGVEVGKDVTLEELRAQGYKAFYMAIGAQGGRKVGIEGEDSQGVMSGIEFLRMINQDENKKVQGKVVVVGGGNVAIDVSRTAVRAGAETVMQCCLESRQQMPAALEEIEEAEEENIVINNGWGPKRILSENGKVTGIEFKKCVSVFDENGRFNPQYDENDVMVVAADCVLLSIGQSIQWGGLLEGTKAVTRPNGTIEADGFTYQTAEPDIFAGGDAYSGPRFAIDAIAAGKQAAISIHRFVQPGQSLVYGRDRRQYKELDKEAAVLEGFDNTPRQRPEQVKSNQKAAESFRDLRGTFTEEQMKKETERCLGCGATVVDDYMCVGCGQCTTKCKFDAIHLERVYDGQGVQFLDMKPVIVKQMVKRQGKIAIKKVKKVFSKEEA
ncbi:FAD-dependent oxidoreductase [Roseburia sp. MSJ-14]|uniref:FAD-dependent oxidoreductase n=1 Tax=Roseburia sp. MSJ-14 TaxID=2841514 RepID=UPI0020A081B1|nr:FAD-dependent oxidoreductase [Roseburia sp. MSJ-14]